MFGTLFHRAVVALEHAVPHCDHLAGSLSPAGLLLLASSALVAALHTGEEAAR